ncbi:T3SS effector HopA1 family protein [Solirubrobacter soli]|uniref:T3SS effector HopA1 family protein n=1 Tax=Solirubrobacter soli TaxID=363832 RepID=UPI000404E4C7|nr:T3SS effector HopA1 family protein [Solirubrobacter soli]
MSLYRQQVRGVLRAVTILPPDRYEWLGRRSGHAPEGAPDSYLVHGLTQELYTSFYCRGRVGPARWGEPDPAGGDARLAYAVARADTGRGGRDGGWTVERTDGEMVVLARGGLRLRAARSDCEDEGATVSVPLPAGPSPFSPGFLTLLGDAGDVRGTELVRAYWHVTERGAAALVGALTRHLNAAGVPFRLKIAHHAHLFDRCDAAVLYIGLDTFRAQREHLAGVAERLACWLRPFTPAFALALRPGLGLAEDHGGPQSFGERRCAQLAEGLVEAGPAGEDERLAVVERRFARDGVALDAPYLDPLLDGRHVL